MERPGDSPVTPQAARKKALEKKQKDAEKAKKKAEKENPLGHSARMTCGQPKQLVDYSQNHGKTIGKWWFIAIYIYIYLGLQRPLYLNVFQKNLVLRYKDSLSG